MRTIVDIPDEIGPKIALIAKRENRSKASVMREAIQEYLNHRLPEVTKESFGLWKERNEDGLSYQDSLRKEWE